MKRNPTLNEKKLMVKLGIVPSDWLVCKHNDFGITLKHKHTGQRKVIPASLTGRR
ncbi:MAG: hypothetical protein IJG48_03540 [Mogibacterium sp.]|nr:hypothetical protein [Mogibacterium sp.]